jgi:hypothetical protein
LLKQDLWCDKGVTLLFLTTKVLYISFSVRRIVVEARFPAKSGEGTEMIKHTLRSTLFILGLACASGAFAQSFTSSNGDTHSEMKDKSNVFIDGTNWGVDLSTGAGDPNLFVNNMVITPGSGYDPLLNMQTQSGGFDYYNYNTQANGHYNFGTAIGGGESWNFQGAFHTAEIDSAVANGIYDFSLGILGGTTNTATDVLANLSLHVDVIQKLDITTTFNANPDTIKEGGPGTEVSMTVTNNMTGRNFISSSWYVGGFGDGNGNYLAFDGFTGDWFDKTITPGGSRTDSHSLFHADLNTPIGTYTGFNGVIGGADSGDFFFMNTDKQAVVTVLVPEPASFAVLGIGALALIRRRKAKK